MELCSTSVHRKEGFSAMALNLRELFLRPLFPAIFSLAFFSPLFLLRLNKSCFISASQRRSIMLSAPPWSAPVRRGRWLQMIQVLLIQTCSSAA